MIMCLDNVVVVIMFSLMTVIVLAKANSAHEEVQQNVTTGSLPSSSSPWLKKVAGSGHDPRPRPHGCRRRPWICREGYHPPPARMMCCRNRCVDVSSDVGNCGFCGIRCPYSWHCCRGFCVNTNFSPFNCGKCGNRCPWGVRCVYGMCGYGQPFPLPSSPWPRPCPPKPPPQPTKGDKPAVVNKIT